MKIESREQMIMHGYLTGLVRAERTRAVFRARRNDIFVERQEEFPTLFPSELALIKIQERGSAESGYLSVSKAEVFTRPLYVSGYDSEEKVLVVGEGVMEKDGSILLPFCLRLEDIIGYKTLQKFSEPTEQK